MMVSCVQAVVSSRSAQRSLDKAVMGQFGCEGGVT